MFMLICVHNSKSVFTKKRLEITILFGAFVDVGIKEYIKPNKNQFSFKLKSYLGVVETWNYITELSNCRGFVEFRTHSRSHSCRQVEAMLFLLRCERSNVHIEHCELSIVWLVTNK